jgi:hypothetical protein
VVSELPALEKALSKGDFEAQKGPLESIVKALRPLRLRSLEQLELNARGRLITTLARVGRQPKPAPSADGAPGEGAAGSEAPPSDAAASEAPVAEASAPVESAPSEGATSEGAPAEGSAPSEGAPAEAEAAAPAEAAGSAPAAKTPGVDPKIAAFQDVMFLVGAAWRAAGDEQRAQLAYAVSGREPGSRNEEPAEESRPERKASDRGGPRGERPPRDRGERGPRADRPPRPEREKRGPRTPLELSGDWKEQATQLEAGKRTRDAARIHERNDSFADATRLFENGGDLKSALRTALAGKDQEAVTRILAGLKPAEALPVLEKAGAYELLMERYVATGDFENVARLYERARQFDQAALAWERAGKLSAARKAYEKVKDNAGASRVRELEVRRLIERGDRLGAALIQLAANQKDEAIATLKALPGPKAFRFLQKAKLEAEAQALAKEELAKAEASARMGDKARWLELLDDPAGAAAAWELAERKDKALSMHEKAGNSKRAAELAEALHLWDKSIALYTAAGDPENAERVKAMPKPAEPPPAPSREAAAEDAAEAAEAAEASQVPPSTESGESSGSASV